MNALTPILLDHRGEPIRSERGLTRQRDTRSAIRARYDAAQTTNENTRHWANADSYGPNAALDPNIRRTLRNRARYETQNNTYAGGMVRTLANDTIGTGPNLQSLTGDKASDRKIEKAFWEWASAIRLAPKLRTMRMAKAVDGEAFASFFTNRPLPNQVKLDLQPHEAEMIATGEFASDSLLNDGIIFDDFGNVVGYRLLNQHPGEASLSFDVDAETVPARFMLHLFNCERAGQVRGAPEITAALPLYAQLRRYTLAVIRAAESAAMFSWFLKTDQVPSEMQFGDSWETLETERGMGMTLPAGYEAFQLKAEQPTSTYESFKRAIISEIARCLGMPYNVAAGDSSGYNYSSGRLDHKTYYRSIRVERSYLELTALDPMLALWWAEARLFPGLLPESVRELRTPPNHAWRWDGDEHVDPVKEAKATDTRLRSGFGSFADEIAKLGGDWEVVFQQNATALGLTLEQYQERLRDYLFGAPAADPTGDIEQAVQDALDNGGASNG